MANEPCIADRITDMTMNGSGTRDTNRVLGISQNTVIRTLKKLDPPSLTPLY